MSSSSYHFRVLYFCFAGRMNSCKHLKDPYFVIRIRTQLCILKQNHSALERHNPRSCSFSALDEDLVSVQVKFTLSNSTRALLRIRHFLRMGSGIRNLNPTNYKIFFCSMLIRINFHPYIECGSVK